MEVKVAELGSWERFKRDWVGRYLKLSRENRARVCFRGHASRTWQLQPTLDRHRHFDDNAEREKFRVQLIEAFRKNCYGLRTAEEYPVHDALNAWEFLGRHHGLPTTILDWTASPYVAAYFAFETTPSRSNGDHVAIWALRYGTVDWKRTEGVELDELGQTVRFNVRAAEQGGLSTRITVANRTLEELVGEALLRIDIPVAERQAALADLDAMMINRRTLFRDLDGAAKAAALQLEHAHG